MKGKSWVIVASCDRARIFNVEKVGVLKELNALIQPQAHMKNKDLTSDKSGRSFNSTGYGSHVKNQKSIPKKKEAENFAKKICKYLEKCLSKGNFKNLYLLIEPKFLGIIRKMMCQRLKKAVEIELGKDLVKVSAQGICQHLPMY